MINSGKEGDAFEFAARELRSEIALFWQRSLFFWGFIAASFIAYGSLAKETDKDLAFAVSCFGIVCSVAWALANRGSKYWQIHWEEKLRSVEVAEFGEDFYSKEVRNPDRRIWGALRYSVTKLAMALSDFTILVWFALMFKVSPLARNATWTCLEIAMITVALVYVIAMLLGAGRAAPPR